MGDDTRIRVLNRNIRLLSYTLLALFLGVMSYMIYFQVFMAEDIEAKQGNVRYLAKTNRVLRGNIYDRDGNVLSFSERQDDGTQKRVYSGGTAFSHPLGYASAQYGVAELEKRMQEHLTNYSFDLTLSARDFLGMLKDPDTYVGEEKYGDNVVTTLDSKLQRAAYNSLGSQYGVVVAMDPSTGEILAMVSTPTYNPSKIDTDYESYRNDTDGVMVNFANVGLYPPGSSFKVVTLASALENMGNALGRTFEDNGKIEFADGTVLPNLGNRAYGTIGLEEALVVSSNVVFGTVAMDIGNAALKKTAEDFGFNEKFSFHDINLEASRFPELSKSQGGEIAQTGIGQGEVLASPLLMAMITSAIANDGVMMQPRLVSAITSHDGSIRGAFEAKALKIPISKEDSDTIAAFMKEVVDQSSSTNLKNLEKLSAAGKTGSAQYSELVYEEVVSGVHSWFIGFAPYENPKIAVAVIVRGGGSGAGAAAAVAEDVMSTYLGK